MFGNLVHISKTRNAVFFRVERWRGFTSRIQIGMERVECLAEEHLAGIGPHLRMGRDFLWEDDMEIISGFLHLTRR